MDPVSQMFTNMTWIGPHSTQEEHPPPDHPPPLSPPNLLGLPLISPDHLLPHCKPSPLLLDYDKINIL